MTCEKNCESTAYKIAIRHFRASLLNASSDLEEAAQVISDWGSYASDYFKDKHDLNGCIKRFEAIAAKYKSIATDGVD